jgi:hypothetical protein
VPNALSGTVTDSFSTTNEFYGGQIGVNGELRRGRWFTNGFTKVAFGTMHQTVTINGAQTVNLRGGGSATSAGGLLALPNANIGTFSQDKFAVVPEVGVNVGVHITPHLRVYVGYNFLYASSVLRAADQIDTGLDVTKIPNFPVTPTPAPLTTNRPTAVPFHTTDFTAQGINFSLQWTW